MARACGLRHAQKHNSLSSVRHVSPRSTAQREGSPPVGAPVPPAACLVGPVCMAYRMGAWGS